MALDLIGGPVFTVLFEGVKLAMGRTETFKELLRDLKFTLECLRRQATAIQQIGQYNVELGLPNDEIEDLERQMHSGARLVSKLLNFRLWNYCCINCYTDQLVDLDRSLRRLLENLMLQEIRDVKEILDLSRKNRKELEEVKEAQLSMHKLLEQIAGVMNGEASTSAAGGGNIQMVPHQNEGNNGDQAVASLEGGTRTALGAIFGMLLQVVIQVKDKNVMFKPLLEDLKSTLESLKPLIEEMTQHNKVLDRPKEELQKFALQMESGVELICKCSKVRLWASYKKYEYTNKLLGLDEFCRRQLSILREQVARDVKETSVSIRNVKEEILVLIRKTATVIKRRKCSTGVVQKSYDKSRPSIHERNDTMSDVQRPKSDEMKQHFRPIAGGAPFITCYNCFKLLRIPTGFPLSKRRCHELRCGVCSNVLKFSLRMECRVCSNVQFSHQKKCGVCSNVLKISLQKKSHVVPYKVLSAAEPPTYEVDNLSSNPASTSEPYDSDPETWPDNYFDRFSYCTSPEVDPGIFTPSDSLKYQYAKKCETDLEFLSNISDLKWDSQCKVVEDVKNYLKCNAQASYSMSSKNFVEPLIKFLRDAHDLDDVKAQRNGFKLLTTFVSKTRNAIPYLCEDAYRLLASSLDSKVTEEVLAIMEILSGHQDCRCKISASGALSSILKLLDSQIRNIQGQAIKVLYNLSSDKEVCSQMVSMECIPKLVPFFEDGVHTGNCISILKNLCDTEGARISIAGTNGCIASVVNILDTGTKEEQEHAVDVLLSLCSQSIDYCHLVMHDGVIPALENLSANGTEIARINSMEVLRLLSDIDYVHEQESADQPALEYLFMGTDVAEGVETVRKPHSFKVHRSMCFELLKLVDRISKIFPEIEAARPRCSEGIKALCVLNSAIEKAKQLLQYCSESSKLYLALTGNVVVSRCQKSRNLLEQSLCQIQSWVPVTLVAEISQIIDDLKGATFKLDPSEEEAGKVVRGLLHQDVSALNSIEDSELKALQLACLRLHITSKKEVLIEKRSIKKLQEKVGDGDARKKQILRHFFYLLKKYENLILVKQTESASTRQQGLFSSENSGKSFECNQYAEVEPHTGYGDYEAQCSTLNTVVPPKEFMCGISSRVMYDPVVIDSGQTYERMWIQKWFDEGHDTCPKTKVKLAHLSLSPSIATKELISMWRTKYGVTIPNPSMQPESFRAWENSSTSIASLDSSMNDLRLQMDLSTMSFGSLDTSFISDASRTKTEDSLSLVEIDDDSLKYQYAKTCETEFLSNISERKWDSQCKVVEDIKNYLECNAQASYSMSSKNFVEPLIKFLRDAHDLDDVKAQRDGFKLLSTFVRKNRKGIVDLCEDTYSLLASYLDSKVTEEVLAIMEILSGHQDCRCKISSSGALPSILELLNSQIRNIQGKVIKVLYNLSFDREICSEMVSLDCIPKLFPFFEDGILTGNCISILKNLCDTEGARISIAETNGCIASIVEVLESGTKEEREHAVDILLSLCSQRIEYCHLVMHEGVIPALVHSSANGTERARINSMEVLRLLRDIDYVHDHEPAETEPEAPRDDGNHSNRKKASETSGYFGKKFISKPNSLSPTKKK